VSDEFERDDEAGAPEAHAATEALIARVEEMAEEERWDEAHALLTDALEDHAEDALVLCWLGIAAQRVGEDGEAYEMFRRALDLEPVDPFILSSAGTGLAALDDPEAERALRLAALTAPDVAFTRAAYGAFLAREGMREQAVTELQAARDLAPDDADVRTELAVALLLAGRGDDGVAELEESLSRRDDGWTRGLYGLALLDAGRDEQAAEELHRASVDRLEDVDVHLASALASAAQGWDDEAWAALARAGDAAEQVDAELLGEVEEAVEAGPDEAAAFLRDQVAPPLLRERLRQQP
jgi:Flp pilus assembly protein TadD